MATFHIDTKAEAERVASSLLLALGVPESNFLLRMQRRADASEDVVWMTADEYTQWDSLLTRRRLPIACVFGKRVVLLDVFDTSEWMRANGYTTQNRQTLDKLSWACRPRGMS